MEREGAAAGGEEGDGGTAIDSGAQLTAKTVRRLRATVFRTENTGRERERIKASTLRGSLRTRASSKRRLTVAPWLAPTVPKGTSLESAVCHGRESGRERKV